MVHHFGLGDVFDHLETRSIVSLSVDVRDEPGVDQPHDDFPEGRPVECLELLLGHHTLEAFVEEDRHHGNAGSPGAFRTRFYHPGGEPITGLEYLVGVAVHVNHGPTCSTQEVRDEVIRGMGDGKSEGGVSHFGHFANECHEGIEPFRGLCGCLRQ